MNQVVPGVYSRPVPLDSGQEAHALINHLDTLHASNAKLNGDKRPTIKCASLTVPGTHLVLQSWKMDEYSYGKPNKPLPTNARGLFSFEHKGKYRIAARGYDKFFNTDEVAATQWAELEQSTSGPYDVTLKSNGCIIFLAGLPDGRLLVTSKHSLGPRADRLESHAQHGEYWIKKHLDKVNRTTEELARVLWRHQLTAVAEMCDDAFEEHILAYPPEKSGLYLHGLNINIAHFTTYPMADVTKFAVHFGMFPTDYTTQPDLPALRALLVECSKSGTYRGMEAEGFVIRTRRSNGDFFFKYKFEEPYLLFRQWREVTNQIIQGKEPVFKKHVTITREYIHFILPLIKNATLAEQYAKSHGIIELRQRFLDHRGGDLTDIINNPEPILPEVIPNMDWFVLVPIATIGCGKTTLALALQHLFGFGHVQNDNILVKKASFIFAQAVFEQLATKRIVFADRNNHMFHERKSLAHDLAGLRKVKDPALHLVAISFEQSEEMRQVTVQRVLARGDNHQSIRAATQGSDTVIKIMDGFHQRFQALDLSRSPDDIFWKVISLDPCKPALANLQEVIRWLVQEKLIQTMPDANAIDKALDYAMSYKPDIVKHVAVHESQVKKKKIPKPVYYGLEILSPEELTNGSEEIIQQFKRNGWLQDALHVTLIHRTQAISHPDIWKHHTSRREADLIRLTIRTTHLVHDAQMVALVVDHASVPLPFANASLHITLGTAPGVKPVAVNALLERWRAGDPAVMAMPFERDIAVQLRHYY